MAVGRGDYSLSMVSIFSKKVIYTLFYTGIVKLLITMLSLVNFFVIEQLIETMTKNSSESNLSSKSYNFHCFQYILASFLINQLETMLDRQYRAGINLLSLQIETDLRKFIISHALKHNSKIDSTHFQRLLCEHSVNIAGAAETFHNIWHAIFEIIVWFGILWATVGQAALIAVLVIVAAVWINTLFAYAARKYEDRSANAGEMKLQKVCEFIDYIRVAKLCGWEDYFLRQFEKQRSEETRNLKWRLFFESVGRVLFTVSPFMVSVSILVVGEMGLGQRLSLDTVYRIQTASVMLRWSCDTLPDGFVTGRKCLKSLKLINSFLDKSHSFSCKKSIADCLINPRNITCVIGSVGSGKTTLIEEILGDDAFVGRISYAPQRCWLENETIRNNILFGKSFEEHHYNQVINACGLTSDFLLLPDLTMVVQNGANLSGGQRQRVSLARAVYQDAPVIVLDDFLSAVDQNLCQTIISSLFSPGGLLANKSVLIASGSTKSLPRCTTCYWLEDYKLVKLDKQQFDIRQNAIESFSSASPTTIDSETPNTESSMKDTMSVTREELGVQTSAASARRFFDQCGLGNLASVIAICLLYHSLLMISKSAIIYWGSRQDNLVDDDFLISHCVTLIISALFFGVLFSFLVGRTTTDGSTRCQLNLVKIAKENIGALVFDDKMQSAVRSCVVLDWYCMDNEVALWMENGISAVSALIASTVAIVQKLGCSVAFAIVLPFAILTHRSFMNYRATLDNQSQKARAQKAEFSNYVASIFSGLLVIRSLNGTRRIEDKIAMKLMKYSESESERLLSTASREFYVRTLMNFAVLCASSTSVIITGDASATVILIMAINQTVDALTRSFTAINELVTKLLTVGRCESVKMAMQKEDQIIYQQRASIVSNNCELSLSTRKTVIELKNFSARYPFQDENILHAIDLVVEEGQRCAVIGRTGSGKSSLTLALMNCLLPNSGTFNHQADFFEQMSFIPQECIQLTGSLRDTVDPYHRSDDESIIKALKLVKMWSHIRRLPNQFDCMLEENDSRISIGQRQLLAIARVLLENRKYLILDEATASVDDDTRDQIKELVDNHFANKTIIEVTHRIKDTLNADIVVLMESGKVVERGRPKVMLNDARTTYSSLWQKNFCHDSR